MKRGLIISVLAVSAAFLALGASAQPAGKKLNVLFHAGKDAVSDLTHPEYVDGLKNGAFKGHNVTAQVGGEGKADYLKQYVKSDLVYVSAHAKLGQGATPIVSGSGEPVYPSDVSRALREANSQGPSLVVVTGCTTLDNESVNLAGASGIKSDTRGRCYIGWKGKMVGFIGDRYFKLFWEGFMTPDGQGRYRTVREAIQYARDHGAPKAWESFEVVGDGSLRASDLMKAAAPGGWVLSDTWKLARGTWVPDIKGVVDFINLSAISSTVFGKATHSWTEPPKSVNPGDFIGLQLGVGTIKSGFSRAYTLLFTGRYSSAARGGGFGVIMIPPSMDWAGEQADAGPLFSGRSMPMLVVKRDKELVCDVVLADGVYLSGGGSGAPKMVRVRAPEPGPDGKFLLIVSCGQATRGELSRDAKMTVDGTASVGGAIYYEYAWKGK